MALDRSVEDSGFNTVEPGDVFIHEHLMTPDKADKGADLLNGYYVGVSHIALLVSVGGDEVFYNNEDAILP